MSKIKLSDYIAKRLKEFHNVKHFFMVSGGGAMHLNDSLGRYIPYTANHHEQACAIAAEGYARINQELAVVNVTTGPGGLNCLNGVFGQWTDSVPVLYISGQVKFTTTMASCPELNLRQLGDQEVDIISCVKPLVKYAKMVTNPNEIKYHLDRAIYEATTGRKGPVWLDIPMNVQGAMIDENELLEFKPSEIVFSSPLEGEDVRRTGEGASKNYFDFSSPLEGEDVRRTGEGYNLKYHRVYLPYTKTNARQLRKEQTPQESKLWNLIRNSKTGYKFRRQHQFDNKYIADFVCLEKKLIIELDGSQHIESFYDKQRTFYLKSIGFDVIRFWNNEIDNNIEGCYEVILEELNTPHPNPLPQGAREHKNTIHPCLELQEIRELGNTHYPQGAMEFTQVLMQVINKLKGAKKPLIVAGHGIRLSKQINNFYKLIEQLQIPVVTSFNGMDIIPTEHPLYMGRIGTIGQRAGNFTLQNADVILFLGTRNNIRQISYNWENFAPKAYKIVVDIDKNELEKPLVKPDLAINCDLADFIPILLEKASELKSANNKKWLDFSKNLFKKYDFNNNELYHSKNDIINVYDFVRILTESMQENDIMVCANGSACVCTHQDGIVKRGQRIFWNSGDASMGYGLPAAIGAYYGMSDYTPHPNSLPQEAREQNNASRQVICLEGDGSIMMNIQELQTISYHKLPIKIFIINNAGYSSIRQTQRNFFNGNMTGSGADSGISVPDFCKLATGFDIKSVKISNPKTMKAEIEKVLNKKEPIICEVMTEKEYAFSPKLSAKKLPDGTMVSPSLEDMFPFLDREEFEENIF